MGGIAGTVPGGVGPDRRARVGAMLSGIAHRGRGGARVLDLGNAVLGTIGSVAGSPPTMARDAAGRYGLCFDGELYALDELRAELGLGEARVTPADVVLRALLTWRTEAFPRLRGQFAIAFWDGVAGTLTLARDRFGVCPLVWAEHAGGVAFGSEVKALQAVGVPTRMSLPDLIDAGVLWGLHPGRTVFEGVRAVPPGSVVTIGADGVRETPYWRWRYADERDSGTVDEQADRLAGLLRRAVERRLPAQGPAVLISGGLDSAAVAGAVRQFYDGPLDSYSAEFTDTSLNEAPFQTVAVGAFETRHRSIVCDETSIARSLVSAIVHSEVPLVRTAPASLMQLAGHIADAGTSVVLSGEGSDELFCGYDLFKLAAIAQSQASGAAGDVESAELDQILHRQADFGRTTGRAYYEQDTDKASDPLSSHLTRWSSAYRITRYLAPPLRVGLSFDAVLDGVRDRLPAEYEDWTSVERAQYLEITYFFPTGGLGSQCDRPYGAHGVQPRFPFLDEDVVDFALTLPMESKLDGPQEKVVVKRAVAEWVPRQITDRVKQPFTAPEGNTLRSVEGTEILDRYLDPASVLEVGIFDAERVAWLVAKIRRGRTSFHDDLALLWILSVQVLAAAFPPSRPQEVTP